MAVGTMSSLGLGSGVLTYDVIDKLRKADEDARIKPIDKRSEKNTEKQAELASLMTLLGTMKSSASYLSDNSSYLERDTSVSGDGVSATAGAGLMVQDIEIKVDRLAKSDVFEVSGSKFDSRESPFTQTNSMLNFYHNENFYSVDIKAGTSVGDVAQAITDATDGAVIGSIMKVGGQKPYQLMISSNEKGAENKILFGNTILSNSVIGGEIETKERGALTFTFLDANKEPVELDISIPKTHFLDSSADNAEVVRDAIRDAIKAEPRLKDLLYDESDSSLDGRNRALRIDLNSKGNSIVINDSRGEDIVVGGSKADVLGFRPEVVSRGDIAVGESVKEGGSIDVDFSIEGERFTFKTDKNNSAFENVKEIVDRINQGSSKGVVASVDEERGAIVLKNPAGKEITILAVGESEEEIRKSRSTIGAVGLHPGTYVSERDFIQETLKLDNIQSAVDAKFTYNDIPMTRSNNYIDDIVSGLSITLERTHKGEDSSLIRISQNSDKLVEEVEGFIDAYNETITKLAEVTKYDENTQIAGVFQGQSEIARIRSALNNVLSFRDSENKSLVTFGIYLNEDGKIDYDKDKLVELVKSDTQKSKEFFKGYTASVNGQDREFDGVFTSFTSYLESLLVDKPEGKATLKGYSESLENELEKYQKERESALKQIEIKYTIMANKFAAYDSIIGQINSNFQALQMQIQSAINSK